MNEQQTGPAKPPEDNRQPQDSFYQPSSNQVSNFEGYDLTAAPEAPDSAPTDDNTAQISWEASEYIHHTKGFGWAMGLIIIAAALLALAIFTGAWTFAAVIVVMAVAIGILAFRPPHVLHYTLSNQGLQVDNHFFAFSDFKAFGVINDGAFYTIMLLPTKRLMPAVNIYFAEENGERIVDILGARLPMEKIEQDPIDKFMRKIRF